MKKKQQKGPRTALARKDLEPRRAKAVKGGGLKTKHETAKNTLNN